MVVKYDDVKSNEISMKWRARQKNEQWRSEESNVKHRHVI